MESLNHPDETHPFSCFVCWNQAVSFTWSCTKLLSTCKNASDTVNKIPHRFLKDSKTETAFVGYSCKSGMNREWMAPKNRRKFIPYLKLMTIFPLTCTTETILEGEKMFSQINICFYIFKNL